MRWAILAAAGVVALHADQLDPGIYGVCPDSVSGCEPIVAPGSVIRIFYGAFGIGPSTPQTATGFPLVTSLAGTSARATVGDVNVDAYILGVESSWIRALLPSSTPLGAGRLVVSYNGVHSLPYRIQVAERSVSLYDGSWCGQPYLPRPPSFCVPRAIQNIGAAGDVGENSYLTPARPGQLVALWGTGLGVAPGDEGSEPIPGNLAFSGLQVLVGGRPAPIIYAGRSGCCAGIDQIIFQAPPGIEGCNVPVWVRFDDQGSTTGDAFLSIASGTGVCSDPLGLSEAEIRSLASGQLTAGQIWTAARFGAAVSTNMLPLGSCSSNSWGYNFAVDLASDSTIDAGETLTLSGPDGSFTAQHGSNGYYIGFPDFPPKAGDYTLDNGAGSAAVAPFRSAFSIPEWGFSWINPEQFAEANFAKGVRVAWGGVDPASGFIEIVGRISTDGENSGVFYCSEAAGKGEFTIPALVFERIRARSPFDNELTLLIGYHIRKRIPVTGVDLLEIDAAFGTAPKTITITPRATLPQ